MSLLINPKVGLMACGEKFSPSKGIKTKAVFVASQVKDFPLWFLGSSVVILPAVYTGLSEVNDSPCGIDSCVKLMHACMHAPVHECMHAYVCVHACV